MLHTNHFGLRRGGKRSGVSHGRWTEKMKMNAETVAEIALIDLHFARAEVIANGRMNRPLRRAIEHIDEAIAKLGMLAPHFDTALSDADELDGGGETLATPSTGLRKRHL